MKYVLFCLVCFFPIMAGFAVTPLSLPTNTGYFRATDQPYYFGSVDYNIIRTLNVAHDYAMLIGSNLNSNDQHWVNFTATDNTMKVYFEHTVNTDAADVLVLEFTLYNDQSEAVDTLVRGVIFPSQQVNNDWLEPFLGNLGLMIAIVFILLLLLSIVFLK